jgi:hypothetical protein
MENNYEPIHFQNIILKLLQKQNFIFKPPNLYVIFYILYLYLYYNI